MKEWLSSSEVSKMKGMPRHPGNVTRLAHKNNWEKRRKIGVKGVAFEYHISSIENYIQSKISQLVDVVPTVNKIIDKKIKATQQINNILSELTLLESIEVIKELSISVGDSEVTCRDFIFDMPARSKLRNKEVFDFVMSLPLRHMQQIEVVNACVDKFGKELSPSRTALNRYWKKLRVLKSLE